MKQSGFARFAWLMLALLSSCVRLGYDAHRAPRDPKPDASHEDAGKKNGGAGSDGSAGSGAGGRDASKQDGSMSDGGTDAGRRDGGGDNPTDASLQDSSGESATDASLQDSGSSDSGPMDSGAGDAATQDAEVDSGQMLPTKWCPERADAVICDDFEENLTRWEYTLFTSGTLDRTTTHARSGAYSAVAMTQAASIRNSEARRGTKVFSHRTSGDIWTRYYYYVPSWVSVTYGFSTIPVSEVEEPYFGFAFKLTASDVVIGVLGTEYASTTTSTPFPRDQWVCIETHVKIHESQGVFEAYMNGALVVTSGLTDTLPDMGYSSMDIGIHYASVGQGPVTVYIDDVLAGYERYGCD